MKIIGNKHLVTAVEIRYDINIIKSFSEQS